MPLLGKLLANLFGGLIAGVVQWLAKRAATKSLVVAALVAAGTALMVVFNTAVAPLVAQTFSTQYGQFLGLAFPPVAGTCLAAISTVWVGCNTYALVKRTVTVQG